MVSKLKEIQEVKLEFSLAEEERRCSKMMELECQEAYNASELIFEIKTRSCEKGKGKNCAQRIGIIMMPKEFGQGLHEKDTKRPWTWHQHKEKCY